MHDEKGKAAAVEKQRIIETHDSLLTSVSFIISIKFSLSVCHTKYNTPVNTQRAPQRNGAISK